MILDIVHVNGDRDDIHNGWHKPQEYSAFLDVLRERTARAYKAGARIIYRPHMMDMTTHEIEAFYTERRDYRRRHKELVQTLPFLDGLERIAMTVLPGGMNSPNYDHIVDDEIREEGSGLVVYGGKYRKACVAIIATETKERNPQAQVYRGIDITFENRYWHPVERFEQLPEMDFGKYMDSLPRRTWLSWLFSD